MKNSVTLLTVAAVISSIQLIQAADLTGKVTLKGTPPPEKTIEMDATCSKTHSTGKPVTTRHYVTGANNGLANVMVFVKEGINKKGETPTETPLLDQVGCVYEPYVMGVMVNQKFKVKNSDPVLHNVHATPKVNKEFNFGQPLKGQVNEKSFSAPEIAVRFKCDVHPWMFAYVSVLEHPYYAVTDKDGNYKISGLPPGEYTVEAFHQKTHGTMPPGVAQKVKVEGDKATADFVVELKQ